MAKKVEAPKAAAAPAPQPKPVQAAPVSKPAVAQKPAQAPQPQAKPAARPPVASFVEMEDEEYDTALSTLY